ncbi:hypothetical protein PRIPAC_96491 [Pristionchus pacificus]|uniref:Uncharacterized protein n=1 Tax=Pristionchus pacificus TaxID=54126 RepID=A0A2A6BJH7_PRIPA|nr:hypothetical protein PRIPAC_96491 [Pristionchus pacificus]|eukprot:PDM66074.1 hypothetical protein PRIPAC_45299 [Pristionchus pacificus]
MESLVAWEIVDASLFLAVLGLSAIGFARAIYICRRVAKDYKKEGDEGALELIRIGPTSESARCLIDHQV